VSLPYNPFTEQFWKLPGAADTPVSLKEKRRNRMEPSFNITITPKERVQASRIFTRKTRIGTISLIAGAALLVLPAAVLRAQEKDDDSRPFLPAHVRVLSTIPGNGDLNPYGVAFVPAKFPSGGAVNPGDILVSNFNSKANLQGTGTTIVRIQGSGPASVFFQGTAPLGLSTALNILRAGFTLVGNFPSPDLSGSCATAQAGSILVINKNGKQVGSIADPSIDGPWDSALFDEGKSAKFFVANGLSGTIVRLDLIVNSGGVSLKKATQIASGYGHQCDPVTFVDAPTGLVYDPKKDVLFVASTVDNAVFEVSDAGDRTHDNGMGKVIYQDPAHLHGALAMTMAPNGHLLVSNNDAFNVDQNQPSEIVEFTTEGKFVREISVDQNTGGSFGLNVTGSDDDAGRFAFVDDNVNALSIWSFQLP
jgi:hypothetical protein